MQGYIHDLSMFFSEFSWRLKTETSVLCHILEIFVAWLAWPFTASKGQTSRSFAHWTLATRPVEDEWIQVIWAQLSRWKQDPKIIWYNLSKMNVAIEYNCFTFVVPFGATVVVICYLLLVFLLLLKLLVFGSVEFLTVHLFHGRETFVGTFVPTYRWNQSESRGEKQTPSEFSISAVIICLGLLWPKSFWLAWSSWFLARSPCCRCQMWSQQRGEDCAIPRLALNAKVLLFVLLSRDAVSNRGSARWCHISRFIRITTVWRCLMRHLSLLFTNNIPTGQVSVWNTPSNTQISSLHTHNSLCDQVCAVGRLHDPGPSSYRVQVQVVALHHLHLSLGDGGTKALKEVFIDSSATISMCMQSSAIATYKLFANNFQLYQCKWRLGYRLVGPSFWRDNTHMASYI